MATFLSRYQKQTTKALILKFHVKNSLTDLQRQDFSKWVCSFIPVSLFFNQYKSNIPLTRNIAAAWTRVFFPIMGNYFIMFTKARD